MKVTLSVIKADIGGYVGHSSSHPDILALANGAMAKAKKQGLLIDYHVTACGDDLQLIMTHSHGEKLKLYGAGQDLLADAFSGNVKGSGAGVVEMEIGERPSQPVTTFMADRSAGTWAWDLPRSNMFWSFGNGDTPIETLAALTQTRRPRMRFAPSQRHIPKKAMGRDLSCFVLQPFGARFEPVYSIIRPTVEGLGLTCKRADEEYRPRHSLFHKIRACIAEADIVISDLTSNRPNVLLETGLAIQMEKKVILMTQTPPLCSDLNQYEYIRYRYDFKGAGNLVVDLKRALKCSLHW